MKKVIARYYLDSSATTDKDKPHTKSNKIILIPRYYSDLTETTDKNKPHIWQSNADKKFINVMQNLVVYDFVLTSCATITDNNKEQILVELLEYNKPILMCTDGNMKNNFWLYMPADTTKNTNYYFEQLTVKPTQSKLIAELFEQHYEEININGYKNIYHPTLNIHYIAESIRETTGYNLERIKPLEDGRYYSLLLLILDMEFTETFNASTKLQLDGIMQQYSHDERDYPNSIIIKGKDGSFWFYYKELKEQENSIFKKLQLDDKEKQKFEEFFTQQKQKNTDDAPWGNIEKITITQPDDTTEKIDRIIEKHILGYKTPLWYRRADKQIGGMDGMVAAKAYNPKQTQYVYKARWNIYDLFFMEVADFDLYDINANLELLQKNAPIIIKDLKSQQFIFCCIQDQALQIYPLSYLETQETEFICCIFNSFEKNKILIATDISRAEITIQNYKSKGIELYELLKNHTAYTRAEDDFEWFFYESFGEGVSSAVFRYILDSQAPKNDLIYIPNQPPGIVSEYLQDDFCTLEEIKMLLNDALPETTPAHNERLKQLLSDYINIDKSSQSLTDEEKDAIIKKLILSQNHVEFLIAVNCFLSDIDGKLANIGILFKGSEKFAARVDFGTAFAKLKNNLGTLCTYLLEANVSPQQNDHSKIYGDLLYAKKFKEALFKVATINKKHLSIIIEKSVARFMYAWRDIKISNKSIDKLCEHLFGEDTSEWRKEYFINNQNEVLFSWQTVKDISNIITNSLTKRQKAFTKLAQDLESIPLLKIFEDIVNNPLNDIKNLDILDTLAIFDGKTNSKAIKSLAYYQAKDLDSVICMMEKNVRYKIKNIKDTEIPDRDKVSARLVQIEYNINWWKILLCLLASLRFEDKIIEIAAKYHLLLQKLHDTDNVEDGIKTGLLALASNIIKDNLFKQKKTYYPVLITTNQYFVISNDLLNKVINNVSGAELEQILINNHTKYAKLGTIVAWDEENERVILQKIILPANKIEFNKYKLKSPPILVSFSLYVILQEINGILAEEDYSEFIYFVNKYTTLSINLHDLTAAQGNNFSFLLLQACVAASTGNLDASSITWQVLKSDKQKWTDIIVLMLHVAVVKKQTALVKCLIDELRKLGIKDFNLAIKADNSTCSTYTVLQRALLVGNADVVELLLTQLIILDIKFELVDLVILNKYNHKMDYMGLIPKQDGVYNKKKIFNLMFSILIDTDYTKVAIKNKEILLRMAVYYGNCDNIKRILKDRNVDINTQDICGCTAVHLSILLDRMDCLATLLEYNPAIEIKNKDNCTPAEIAELRGNTDALQQLMKASFKINQMQHDLQNTNNNYFLAVIDKSNGKNITLILKDIMDSKYYSGQLDMPSHKVDIQRKGPVIRRRSLSSSCLPMLETIRYK